MGVLTKFYCRRASTPRWIHTRAEGLQQFLPLEFKDPLHVSFDLQPVHDGGGARVAISTNIRLLNHAGYSITNAGVSGYLCPE